MSDFLYKPKSIAPIYFAANNGTAGVTFDISSETLVVIFDHVSLQSGVGYSLTGGEITIEKAGKYFFDWCAFTAGASFNTSSTDEVWFDISVNNVEKLASQQEKKSASKTERIGAFNVSGTIELAVGDIVRPRIRRDSGGQTTWNLDVGAGKNTFCFWRTSS